MNSLTEKETEFYQLYKQEAEKCHTLETQLNMMKQQLMEMKGLAAIKLNILTLTLHYPYGILYLKIQLLLSESTIDKKLEEFQKALYRHQITTPDIKIYDPHDMQKFTDKNSLGLSQDILNCITGGKILTEKRRQLQEQRAVALLHIFAYFRCVL